MTPGSTARMPASSVIACRKRTLSNPSRYTLEKPRAASPSTCAEMKPTCEPRRIRCLALVEVGQVLAPVDPVVEPVQDQQQHADRDHRDDRLELLAVERERAEHGLGDHPGDRGGGQRDRRAGQERAPVTAVDADHARHQRGEDQDGLEPFAEDDDGAVRDHGGRRAARADALRRLLELGLKRSDRFLELGACVLALDELHEPGLAAVAVPEEALDPLEQRGRDPAQPLLGAELEDPVRLQPRLLRPAPAARLRGRREAVDRGCDDVEVGAGGRLLPGIGVEVVDQLQSAVGARADCLGGLRPGPQRPRPACCRAPRRSSVSSRVAAGSRASNSGEMSASAAATAFRKLIASWISNASVTRVPSTPRSYSIGTSRRKRSSWPARRACSAAASGAARNPSSRRSTSSTAACGRSGRRAARGNLIQPVERALEFCSRCVAALAAVARPDDRGVPVRECRLFGEPCGEAAA